MKHFTEWVYGFGIGVLWWVLVYALWQAGLLLAAMRRKGPWR